MTVFPNDPAKMVAWGDADCYEHDWWWVSQMLQRFYSGGLHWHDEVIYRVSDPGMFMP
jgi:hypothetical protein